MMPVDDEFLEPVGGVNWNGSVEGRASTSRRLKAQAKGPIQAGVEMNSTPERVIATLNSMPEYVARFERSFLGQAEPVTFDNVAKAIEAFEATLITLAPLIQNDVSCLRVA